MKGALRLSRAFAAFHAATLTVSAAMQRLADRINENTNRAKWRAIYKGVEKMSRGGRPRKHYYDPGKNPQPANPLKGIGGTRKGLRKKFQQPGNNERIAEARRRQEAKELRRIARNRKSAGLE